jgi:hypothetical protein
MWCANGRVCLALVLVCRSPASVQQIVRRLRETPDKFEVARSIFFAAAKILSVKSKQVEQPDVALTYLLNAPVRTQTFLIINP